MILYWHGWQEILQNLWELAALGAGAFVAFLRMVQSAQKWFEDKVKANIGCLQDVIATLGCFEGYLVSILERSC